MMFFRSFGGGIEMKGERSAAGVDDQHQQRPQGAFVVAKHQPQEHHHHLQQQEQQPTPECFSDEVDSRSGDGGGTELEQLHVTKKIKSSSSSAAPPAKAESGGGGSGDGAIVEILRKPRGRPPGSKNKPKPPVVITHYTDDDPSSSALLRAHVIEILSGEDVANALAHFSRRRGLGLSVLAGSGLVSNVVLRPNLSFQGQFEILSISATFFPPSFAPSSTSALPAGGGGLGFAVTLAGPQGHIFGGLVAGTLTAVGNVTILAATFCNPTYHRLPAEDDVSVSVSVSVSGGADVETAPGLTAIPPRQPRQRHNTSSRQYPQRQQPPYQQQRQQRSASPSSSSDPPTAAADAQHYSHHHLHLHHPAAAVPALAAGESCGISIYGGHQPSDVIWAPAARSPPY